MLAIGALELRFFFADAGPASPPDEKLTSFTAFFLDFKLPVEAILRADFFLFTFSRRVLPATGLIGGKVSEACPSIALSEEVRMSDPLFESGARGINEAEDDGASPVRGSLIARLPLSRSASVLSFSKSSSPEVVPS
jgi:hypothetical protein